MTKTVGMTSKIKVCSYHHLLECLPYQTYGVLFKYNSLLYKGRPPQRSAFSNSWTSDCTGSGSKVTALTPVSSSQIDLLSLIQVAKFQYIYV